MGSSITDDGSDSESRGIKVECNLSRKDKKKKKKNPRVGFNESPSLSLPANVSAEEGRFDPVYTD